MSDRPAGGPGTYEPKAGKVAWVVFYVCALATVALGLYAVSVPGLDFFLAIAVIYAGVAIGLTWVLCFSITAFRARLHITPTGWMRWLGIPILGTLFVVLVAMDVPLRVRFELSRPALEQAEARVEAGETIQPGWIGLYPIERIDRLPNGARFLVSGSGFLDPCGFAYNRGERPPVLGEDSYYELVGGWWVWRESW